MIYNLEDVFTLTSPPAVPCRRSFLYQLPWLPERLITSGDLDLLSLEYGDLVKRGRMSSDDMQAYQFVFSRAGELSGLGSGVGVSCRRRGRVRWVPLGIVSTRAVPPPPVYSKVRTGPLHKFTTF